MTMRTRRVDLGSSQGPIEGRSHELHSNAGKAASARTPVTETLEYTACSARHRAISLGYQKLEPRRVLAVIGSFNGGTGLLDITLDADFDTATIAHDGVNVTLNGSKDLDPFTGGSQEALIGSVNDIRITGDSSKFGQTANLLSDFDSSSGIFLNSLDVFDIETLSIEGHYELGGNLSVSLSGFASISDNGPGHLTVGGDSTIDVGDGTIELDDTQNQFLGTLNVTAAGSSFADATIVADGDILLGNVDVDGDFNLAVTGSISNAASATIDVDGLTTLLADDFDAGNGNNAIHLGDSAGDFVSLNTLSFQTVDNVIVEAESSVSISDFNTAYILALKSDVAITNEAFTFMLIGGTADFEAPNITIGDQFDDYFDAQSLTFQSTGDVFIESDFDITLTGPSEADSLSLLAYGDIYGEVDGSLVVAGDVYLNAYYGSGTIDLGSSGFLSQFGHFTTEINDSLQIDAYDAFLSLTGNVTLGHSYVLGTLFLDVQPGFVGGRFGSGDVYQEPWTIVNTTELGILSTGSVHLSDVEAVFIGIQADLASTISPGFTFNGVTDSSILGDAFGIAVVGYGDMFVDTVFDPITYSLYADGLTANAGHIYVETIGFGNLFLASDVYVADPSQTITAIAGQELVVFPWAQFARGSEGFVSVPRTPLAINGGTVGNLIPLDTKTGNQDFGVNFGVFGDLAYSAQVRWADGSSEFFSANDLANLNPNSSLPGDANPIGFAPIKIAKANPFTESFLQKASILEGTFTVYNDASINLYQFGGAENLNATTFKFVTLLGQQKVAIGYVQTESNAPSFAEPRPVDMGEYTFVNHTIEVSSFDDENLYLANNMSEIYTVRVAEGLEADKFSWTGEFGANEIDQIREAILSNPDFKPGTYSVRRVTPEGATAELAVFVKTPGALTLLDELESEGNDNSAQDTNDAIVDTDDVHGDVGESGELEDTGPPSTGPESEVAPVPFDDGAKLESSESTLESQTDVVAVDPITGSTTDSNNRQESETLSVIPDDAHTIRGGMIALPLGLILGSARFRRALQSSIRREPREPAGVPGQSEIGPPAFTKRARRNRKLG